MLSMVYTASYIFHILLMLLFRADTREREQHSVKDQGQSWVLLICFSRGNVLDNTSIEIKKHIFIEAEEEDTRGFALIL